MNQRTIFAPSVSDKINALLERTSNLKRARDLDRPVTFDREGERHARQVAKQEAERHG